MQQFKWTVFLTFILAIGINSLSAQSIKPTNEWKSGVFKTTVNIEDDLLIYVDMGKSLMDAATASGVSFGGPFYGRLKGSLTIFANY